MLRRQHKVDDQHLDMPLIYYMEGHSLHFHRREFSLITGFCFGIVNFDLHPSSDLKFCNRVFPNKIGYIITNLDIIGVIEDEERFGKLSDDDIIRLCLLLALEVIFMGRLLSFKVDDTLSRLIENLDAWNSFPWDEHLWCHLYDEIMNLKQRHSDEHYYGLKKDRNYVPTYTLSGFLFAFQDYLREEELRLCLEDEEMLLCEHGDLIVEENRFRLDEANRLRNFWLKLVCLDPARKGWLTKELLLCLAPIAKRLALFYANGERYTAPWSKVDQVFIPINEMGEHWCLAQFHILSGEVTFYDIGYAYDYDYRDC
ncbi:phospholipase-like protein [Tanacetum coccineum]